MRIICWMISLSIVIVWLVGNALHPDNILFPHNNFFLRNAIHIFFLNAALLMFALPFLMEKRIIGNNYHKEDDLGKAKMFLIFYTIAFPGLFLIFIASWITGVGKIPYALMMLLFCYGYLKNSYIFIKKRPPK